MRIRNTQTQRLLTNFIIGLFTLLSLSQFSYAKSDLNRGQKEESTAYTLGTKSSSESYSKTYDATKYQANPDHCRNWVKDAADEILRESQIDVKFECSQVFFRSQASTRYWKRSGYGKFRGWMARVEALCVPRSLWQKQIYHQAMICDKNPHDLCYSDSFRQNLKEFQPTIYDQVSTTGCKKTR